MNIAINATTIELTPTIKDYIEKRFKKVAKYATGVQLMAIDVGKTTEHHRQGDIFEAKANVTTALGKQYYAVSQKEDLYEAIDDLRTEIIREITSAQEKRTTLFRRGAQQVKRMMRGLRP